MSSAAERKDGRAEQPEEAGRGFGNRMENIWRHDAGLVHVPVNETMQRGVCDRRGDCDLLAVLVVKLNKERETVRCKATDVGISRIRCRARLAVRRLISRPEKLRAKRIAVIVGQREIRAFATVRSRYHCVLELGRVLNPGLIDHPVQIVGAQAKSEREYRREEN